MVRMMASSILAAVAILVTNVPNVWAQAERSLITVTVGGAFGDGGAAPAIGIAGAFGLAPHAALELELAYMPHQEFDRRFFSVPQIFPTPAQGAASSELTGRTVAFLASFVTALEGRRLRPFALFGGGLANVGYKSVPTASGATPVSPTSPNTVVGSASPSTSTENALALTAGGGFDIRVRGRLGVGADVRYLRLLGTSDSIGDVKHITRVGARLELWF